jgi:hypothetical protein
MVGPFSSTVRQQLGLGERDRLDSNSAFEHLNDLAERRNLVAHGQVADRLSLNLLKDLVQYVSDLCISIEQAVSGAILQHLMEYQSKSTIEPLQVINSEIACIRLQSRESVSVGDYLVSVRENGSGPYEASEITSIQIDSQSCKCVSGFLDLDIGLTAKHRIKSNHRLAVIPEGEISGLI